MEQATQRSHGVTIPGSAQKMTGSGTLWYGLVGIVILDLMLDLILQVYSNFNDSVIYDYKAKEQFWGKKINKLKINQQCQLVIKNKALIIWWDVHLTRHMKGSFILFVTSYTAPRNVWGKVENKSKATRMAGCQEK